MNLRTLILGALCACAFQLLPAAEPLERIAQSHLGLEAQLMANSAKAVDHFKTDYGSSDMHTEKSRAITITARNFAATPAKAELGVYWIGKQMGGNARVLLTKESKKLTIAPRAAEGMVSNSGEVRGSDLKLVMIGVRRTGGYRIEGWVVLLRDDGDDAASRGALLGVKASDTHLAELARTAGWLTALPAAK